MRIEVTITGSLRVVPPDRDEALRARVEEIVAKHRRNRYPAQEAGFPFGGSMFRVLSFSLRYLPVIITAVKTVEDLADPKTPGDEKKALVLRVLTDVLSRFGVELSDAYLDVASSAIDTVVAVLNALGLFRHSADEPAEPEPVEEAVVAAADVKKRVEAAASDERFQEFVQQTAR